jgi:hypothetical protein
MYSFCVVCLYGINPISLRSILILSTHLRLGLRNITRKPRNTRTERVELAEILCHAEGFVSVCGMVKEKFSARAVGVSAQIQTQYLLNTGLQRYGYISPIGKSDCVWPEGTENRYAVRYR